MSKTEARRQKQLARKKAKRAERRTQMARQTSDNPLIRLAGAEAWPIVECIVPEAIWSEGIGQLVLARRLPDGMLATASFLVDRHCLGVKDAYWGIMSEGDFDVIKRKLREVSPLQSATPAQFAKLIYGAVDFAQSFGIAPHTGYRHAKLLLAGIDSFQCTDTFEYGMNGKPYYISGPYDSPEKIKVIMHKVRLAGGHWTVITEREDLELSEET
jgi:hypothetical protein